jgi:hypothetical protein
LVACGIARDRSDGTGQGFGRDPGRKEFTDVVEAMAPAFERWAAVWLTQATAAAGFAHFLVTEAGSVLLASGVLRLAAVVSSFRKGDWDH